MTSYEREQKQGIYFGSRGSDFQNFITGLLKRGKLKDRYIDILTSPDAMKLWSSAFTSELVDPENNYQVLEQVGDLSGNKFIVNYMYARFPQLDCTDGVKVVARLRINYGAKQSFSEIARRLGFWKYITATNETRQSKMKPLLEDVFEAFLGATERLLDRYKRNGVGYAIVYDILKSVFDEMDISLKYEDLYDAKTRLKELFDLFTDIGSIKYSETRHPSNQLQISTIYWKRSSGPEQLIGTGTASLKPDAQQKAAVNALKFLNKNGYIKPVPEIYQRFNDGNDIKAEKVSPESIQEIWTADSMNTLQSPKEKSKKYQNKYMCIPIAGYCRQRNVSGVNACLSLNADPNIADTDGMYPLDLLFVGNVDEKSVKKIMKSILKKTDKIMMNKNVYDMYFDDYVDDYFSTIVERIDFGTSICSHCKS